MPKDVYYIRDFSGGINSQRNPRDIRENESPFCQDAMGDRLGMLRTMGNGAGDLRDKDNSSSAYTIPGGSATITALASTDLLDARGHGFKHFELDYDEGGAEEEGGEHYLAVVSEAGVLSVWDYTNNSWDSTPTTAGAAVDLGGAEDVKADIIAFDNGLRIHDTDLSNGSTPKYYKYIKRSQLTASRDGFYGGATTLLPPVAGDLAGSGYTDGSINFDITEQTDGASLGTWKKSDYIFAYSFVYDGNQESTLRVCPTTLADASVTANKPLKVDVRVANAGGADFDSRITGARIYWKYYDEAEEKIAEGEWNLFVDCDFTGGLVIEDADVDNTETTVDASNDGTTDTSDLAVGMEVASSLGGVSLGTKIASITDVDTFEMTNAGTASPTNTHLTFRRSSKQFGIRGKLSDEYTMWTNTASGDYTATILLQDPSLDNYATINGYNSNDGKLYIGDSGDGFKSSVFANRRMFTASVKMTFEDGVQRQKLDRIMYSPVNKPDVFPLSNYIDVIQGDAEPYIKLESIGNKLFAFKSDNLYILNIGNSNPAGWYLESTHKGMGVMSSGSVFKTDFGLVWVNPNGLYAYQSGSGITELTEDKILSGYKTDSYGFSSWGKLITVGTIIGYDKKEKEIVIALNSGSVVNDQVFGGNGADVVVYDLETKSFFFGKNRLLSAGVASNFDYDWNGDLTYASETNNSVTVKAWQSDDQTSTSFIYQTKDFDFGTPARYKKIYAIYITYKHSHATAAANFVKYVQDGGTSFIITNLSNNSLDQATIFEIAKVTFDTPLKCQSIALQLNGGTNATKIEINDIGIEYRLLPSGKVAATS